LKNDFIISILKTKKKRMDMSIVSSNHHTKQWRQEQTWYQNGKHNECELFQRQILRQLTGLQWEYQKGVRLNIDTLDLCHKKSPMNDVDGFEWTEDFDGFVEHQSNRFYLNLKFICDQGGAQTRSLREVYHFIKTQLRHLEIKKEINTYFINILDGNTSFKNMPKFTYLLNKFSSVKNQVFVGDIQQFQQFWSKEINHPIEKKMPHNDLKKKKELGQFFTTNYKKILKDLYVPSGVSIIEPFAGAGDLLQFINDGNSAECYDIDPKQDYIIRRDTFQDPPCYDNKFVLTNPPYLAKNKCKDKEYFDRYKTDDLYKCFMKQLVGSEAIGGIVVIPVNFWCSIRRADMNLRNDFLKKFHVIHLNIFEEQVFQDTTYSVCAFQFERKQQSKDDTIQVSIYPCGKHFTVKLSTSNHFLIGGEIYNLKRTHVFQITRLTKFNKDQQHTNILLKCIDDEKPIGVSLVGDRDVYVDDTPNTSARSYATLVIDPPISLETQKCLVNRFNALLQQYREEYYSLFLSNYRENQRKRISFDLAYHIVGHLLEKQVM
jgi:hypothetical protein